MHTTMRNDQPNTVKVYTLLVLSLSVMVALTQVACSKTQHNLTGYAKEDVLRKKCLSPRALNVSGLELAKTDGEEIASSTEAVKNEEANKSPEANKAQDTELLRVDCATLTAVYTDPSSQEQVSGPITNIKDDTLEFTATDAQTGDEIAVTVHKDIPDSIRAKKEHAEYAAKEARGENGVTIKMKRKSKNPQIESIKIEHTARPRAKPT